MGLEDTEWHWKGMDKTPNGGSSPWEHHLGAIRAGRAAGAGGGRGQRLQQWARRKGTSQAKVMFQGREGNRGGHFQSVTDRNSFATGDLWALGMRRIRQRPGKENFKMWILCGHQDREASWIWGSQRSWSSCS